MKKLFPPPQLNSIKIYANKLCCNYCCGNLRFPLCFLFSRSFSLSLSILLLISIFALTSCNTIEPPGNETISLKLEDVSCTEAWITLTTNNLQLPATLNLIKDNNLTKTINLQTADTLLYIDSLQPNKTYKISISHSGLSGISSNELTCATLDTTSHNFTWQTFTFGQHSSSVLYDVAIIDENNIWAVGAIYMNDSLGNIDHNAYNAVHWNGREWELHRIMFFTICGQQSRTAYPANAIFTFNENDIWIAMDGDQIAKLENGIQVKTICLPWSFSINKMWGSSSNDLYAVGNGGNIAHYNGTSWRKIESGTTVDLLDVWGSPDGTIWTCGYTSDYGTSSIIKIKNGISQILFEGISNSKNNGYYVGPMSGIWSDNIHRTFLMTWQGIYLQKNNNQFLLEKEITGFSDVGLGIDGTRYNNVFAAGQRFVGHWNGYTYREYPELFQQQRTFKSVKANANIVCAVGLDYNSPIYSNAVIVFGK